MARNGVMASISYQSGENRNERQKKTTSARKTSKKKSAAHQTASRENRIGIGAYRGAAAKAAHRCGARML
jgi:hypothetical protein